MAEVNLDFLISLVESRAMIWDKTDPLYKDRNGTRNAWNEVFAELDSDFEDLDETEQNNFGRAVMKKWGNIRDSFKKYLKKQRRNGSTITKPYIYNSKLQFLNKAFPERATDSPSFDTGEPEIADEETPRITNETIITHDKLERDSRKHRPRKRKLTDDSMALKELSERHMSFFNGIMPSLHTFDNDETLEFQMGVLQTISSIRQRKKLLSCKDPLANQEVSTSGGHQNNTPGPAHGSTSSYFVIKSESSSDTFDFST